MSTTDPFPVAADLGLESNATTTGVPTTTYPATTTEDPFPLATHLENFLYYINWNSTVSHGQTRDFLGYEGLITYTVPSLLSLGSIPISVFIIYRILTRQSTLNNYQIGVVFQCLLGVAMAVINFYHVWYLLFTASTWKTKITVVYFSLYNISVMGITVFSVHWKNQFSKSIKQLAATFIVLCILGILDTTVLYVRYADMRLFIRIAAHFGNQANFIEFYLSSLFFLISTVVNVGCLVFLKKVDLTTFSSPGVLKGIKRMTIGLMCKMIISIISMLINFEISRAVWASSGDTPENHYLWPVKNFLRYIYPLQDALLTRYCVSGLLKKTTPDSSAPGSIKSDSVVSANFRQKNVVQAWQN